MTDQYDHNHEEPKDDSVIGEFVDAEFVESDHLAEGATPADVFGDTHDGPTPDAGFAADPQDEADASAKAQEDVARHERPTPEQVGENIVKFATDTAYAAVGFAGLVGEKAKAFYEEQKRQYAETHPDAEKDPGAKDFLAQLREKVDHFVEELTKGYREMAERGRAKAERGETPATDVNDEAADVTLDDPPHAD